MDHTVRTQPGWALAAAIGLTVLLGSASGCYTMLRHPSPDEGFAAVEDARCQRCHDDGQGEGGDVNSWIDYYAYSSSPWLNYYASPWWHDTEWVLHPIPAPAHAYDSATGDATSRSRSSDTGDGEAAADGGRLTWSRRIMADEPSPHDRMDRSTSSSAPIISAPNPARGAGAGGPPVTVTRDTDSEDQSPAEEKKLKRSKKGRAIRR